MASPMMFDKLRLKNIFDPILNPPMGNDLPQQGGITGNLPIPQGNIFGPQMPDFGPAPNQAPPLFNPAPMDVAPPGTPTSRPLGSSADRILAEMAKLYTPETTASEAFSALQNAYPDREDYKPSMLRRIGSALTAVGGSFGPRGYQMNPQAMQAGMGLLNQKFDEKLADWKNQIGPAYQGASLERQSNVNERTAAYQTISQQLRAEADEERARNNQRNADIRQQRADVYEYKARNPNLKLIFPKGGNVQAFDPGSGKTSDLGIPTGSLTDADKMSLQQENALGQIAARTEGQLRVEGAKQEGRAELAWSDPYEVKMPDGTTKYFQTNKSDGSVRETKFPGSVVKKAGSTTGAGRPETPQQTRVRQFIIAQELRNSRPDLAPHIKLGRPGSNDFVITPPGKNIFGSPTGPSQEQHNEINQLIYGDIPIAPPTRTGANTPTTPTPTKTPTTNQQAVAPVTARPKQAPGTSPAPTQPDGKPVPGNILTRTQTNQQTGQKRTLVSIDGGKTWQVQGASPNR